MYKENGPQNLIIIIVSETGPYLNIFIKLLEKKLVLLGIMPIVGNC